MRITLCYPALLPGRKPTYGLQPLGVLYIAAVLRRDGFDVDVIDADVDGLTIEEMVGRILARKPDLVGLSLMTPQLLTSLAVARCSRRRGRSCRSSWAARTSTRRTKTSSR